MFLRAGSYLPITLFIRTSALLDLPSWSNAREPLPATQASGLQGRILLFVSPSLRPSDLDRAMLPAPHGFQPMGNLQQDPSGGATMGRRGSSKKCSVLSVLLLYRILIKTLYNVINLS